MAKILLVEDDNNLREIFEMRLQAEGYQTLTAGDGEAALVVAMKEKPDLIIADVMMPKMSGFEMLETLRAAPEMAQTKVIMMSALGQAEDQARGAKLGVIKYLVKSQVTLEDFARVVSEVLGPGSATAAPAAASTNPATDATSTNNNKVESEKSMDDTTPSNPTDPTMPTPPADGDSGAPAPGGMGDSGQQSTADEQSTVNSQVADFTSGAPAAPADPSAAPAADPAGDGSTEHDEVPVMPPPPTDPAMPTDGSGTPAA